MMKTKSTYRMLLCFIVAAPFAQTTLLAQTEREESTANAFVTALSQRNYEALVSLEAPALLEKVSADHWKTLWNQLETNMGAFQRHAYREKGRTGDHPYVIRRAYFERDSIDFRIVFDSLGFVAGFWLNEITPSYAFKAPPYARALSFREEMVTIGDTIRLSAKLAIPEGRGPFAAAILVHGSGPHDMDETIYGNKPFRDIAWGLASRGVMVLRYDKRSKAHPEKMNPFTTTVKEEVIEDVLNAVKFLRTRSDLDTNRLSIIGHSLGAMLAPEIATLEPSVKGVALLGAPVRHLEELALEQMEYIASLMPMTGADSLALQKQRERAEKIAKREFPPRSLFIGAPALYYYDLHDRMLVGKTRALNIPVFILQGGKDYQVPMREFDRWQSLLQGNENVRFHLCETCHHLFITTDETPQPSNYRVEGHVDETVIRHLADWCKRKW